MTTSQKIGAGVGRICYPTGRRLAKPPYSRHPPLNIEKIRADYDEDRWIGIGMLRERVVVIVFTERREDTIRVISLRKALSHERVKYEQILRDQLGAG